MEKPKSKRSIQEFWIDFLLEEELACSPGFASNFVARCGFIDAEVNYVVHSQSDQFGETDLFVACRLASGDSAVLLIEDKINAGFQAAQAERYKARGQHGVEEGIWCDFRTVLVAPSRYIGASSHGFDVALSLEEVVPWLCPDDNRRGDYKRARLEQAIQKKNTTGVQIVDQDMTEYRSWYADRVTQFNLQRGTDWVPPRTGPTWWGDDWIQWKSEALPPHCQFRHMSRKGVIEIAFANTPLSELAKLEPLLQSGMKLKSTGKHKQHSAIQVEVPPISKFDDIAALRATADEALNHARRLEALILSAS